MLKVIESKSEVKKCFRECSKKKVPCLTLQFWPRNGILRGDFTSSGVKLSDTQLQSLADEQKKLINQFSRVVESSTCGVYPEIKLDANYAYKLGKQLAGIMFSYAKVSIPPIESVSIPIARVIYVTEHQLHVRCPFCGKVHHHGKESFGAIEAHCEVIDPGFESYFICD